MANVKTTLPEVPVPGKPLGRSLVEHDPKSRNFPLAARLDRPKPRKGREWYRRDVFDQNTGGPYNSWRPEASCTFQAVAGLLVASPHRMDATVHARLHDLLDPAFRWKGYRLAQTLDAWDGDEETTPRYEGSSGVGAAKAAKALGLVPEDWEYRWAFGGVDEVKEALDYAPVAVGTVWRTGMDNPDAKGIVRNEGDVRGGHEWYIGDWNPPTKTFDAWNSWGKAWGQKGRFRVPETVLAELLAEDGDALQWVPPTSG